MNLARRIVVAVISLSSFVVSGCAEISRLPTIAESPARQRLVTAHRANLHHPGVPDNSLPAIEESIALGVPFLEVDVRLTEHDQLILFHDGSINSSNTKAPYQLRGRPIQSLTPFELTTVFLDDKRSIRIPTLAEALDRVRESKSTLQLDLKGESDTLAFKVLDLVSSRGQLGNVLIQIRDPKRITAIKERYPSARILARCLNIDQVSHAIAEKVEFVELERWMTSEAIQRAHSHNINVLINVAGSRFDEKNSWSYLRTRGVDSIMTDKAELHLGIKD